LRGLGSELFSGFWGVGLGAITCRCAVDFGEVGRAAAERRGRSSGGGGAPLRKTTRHKLAGGILAGQFWRFGDLQFNHPFARARRVFDGNAQRRKIRVTIDIRSISGKGNKPGVRLIQSELREILVGHEPDVRPILDAPAPPPTHLLPDEFPREARRVLFAQLGHGLLCWAQSNTAASSAIGAADSGQSLTRSA
jgi:hypothetical protein